MSRRLRCNRIGVICLEQGNGLTDATRKRITVASQCNGASEKCGGDNSPIVSFWRSGAIHAHEQGEILKMKCTFQVDEILARRLWDNEECPHFDLIMHADGRIYPLQANDQKISDKCCTNSIAWMPVSQVPGMDDSDNLNEGFTSLYRKDLPHLDLVLRCGECCSSGENGFVSLARLSTGALIWLVFLTSSNPFESAEIDHNEVIATSTDGRKYIFRLENPEFVRMVEKANLS